MQGEGIIAEQGAPAEVPFGLRRWKEPPHVALANLRPETAALLAFTRRYGVVSRHTLSGFISASDTGRFGEHLRQAWRGDEKVLSQIGVDLSARLRVGPTGLEIVVDNLWTLIRLMFLRDWVAGRAKVCTSPDCPAPYFLAVRKGQKFCSQRCAVLINVRRFREREAKQRAKRTTGRTRRRKYAKAKKA